MELAGFVSVLLQGKAWNSLSEHDDAQVELDGFVIGLALWDRLSF